MKKEAILYKRLKGGKVHCLLCANECRIPKSELGICKVRQNIDGKLYALTYAKLIAANVDPIEKKPLYHFLPGSMSYSIASPGCNFRCGFCQNWNISQVTKIDNILFSRYELTPEDVVSNAQEAGCRSISYTYTEPTMFFEYAIDVAKLAKERNIRNVFVTNGYMSKKAINTIKPFLDVANIDLKFYNDTSYRKICGGSLEPVLDSIRLMKDLGIWVEVTTLIIPGQNDSDKELRKIAKFIANVGKETPWHVSRFHPSYEYRKREITPLETLKKAKEIGENQGLKYTYIGNVGLEGIDTYCAKCRNLLIKRSLLSLSENNLINGKCTNCETALEGVF